jgi:hypothetical protein
MEDIYGASETDGRKEDQGCETTSTAAPQAATG